ncbi:MAG: hypothetical protein RLZZ453_489 [Chlamydiota bacterium]|jgi:hypothetical protein
MIGLTLITTALVPLVRIPLAALRQEVGSLYQSQIHNLADAGFAKVQEMLLRQEIPWDKLTKTEGKRITLFEDVCTLSLDSQYQKKFKRKAEIKLVSIKNKNQEEWALMVVRITIKASKKQKNRSAYYVTLCKKNGT